MKRLADIYLLADPRYTGRVTVPVLWDKKGRTIVNSKRRCLDTLQVTI
jgi:glutathionyl-hydroquinone reductase